MIRYLKTKAQPELILQLLKRYLQMNKYSVIIQNKLVVYLDKNYNITIYYIIDELINNIRVKPVNKELLEIVILNEKIEDTTLQELLQLVEYGNLDIQPSKAISKLLQKSLNQVSNYLGGV